LALTTGGGTRLYRVGRPACAVKPPFSFLLATSCLKQNALTGATLPQRASKCAVRRQLCGSWAEGYGYPGFISPLPRAANRSPAQRMTTRQLQGPLGGKPFLPYPWPLSSPKYTTRVGPAEPASGRGECPAHAPENNCTYPHFPCTVTHTPQSSPNCGSLKG